MLFNLFRGDPLLDEPTRLWLLAVFAWALRHQGRQVFFEETDLVLPTPEYFPGRANNVHGMAQLVFEAVRNHAGLAAWPCRLAEPGAMSPQAYPQHGSPMAHRARRNPDAPAASGGEAVFHYSPGLVANPEALIAHFAVEFGGHVARAAPEPPPGGADNWPHVTELVGVFMGFGIMLANTAFSVRVNSCGSCQGPAAERAGYLSRADLTYALALFCRLKGIPGSRVRHHLKAPLRSFFRRALRDIDRNPDSFHRLMTAVAALPAGARHGAGTLAS